MITNAIISIYHKTGGRKETYTKYQYKGWQHSTNAINISNGESNSNTLTARIPYEGNENLDKISVGDLLVLGADSPDIEHASDLSDYRIITSITDNQIGDNPHIHLGAK